MRSNGDVANTGSEAAEQGRDGPFYRFRTAGSRRRSRATRASLLESVRNVDVEVRLTVDGSRWSATMFTLAEVERTMDRWSRTGEGMGGRYFWCFDGPIVRDPGIDSMTQVLAGLLDDGGFAQVLRRLDDE
ncbi:hypothetical protein [Streptomyces tanashiensis]|uniref:hypothetical protein n=1 Tax=Streptomyces tanashiensis TaxID=67367 RepID=UPI003417A29A